MFVQLIDFYGKSIGIVSFNYAKQISLDKKLSLVKVGINSNNILIYKLFDLKKYLFLKKKKIKKNKRNLSIKEYYINFNIEDRDLYHIFDKINYSLKKGNIICLYINNCKQFLKINNKDLFVNKIKKLIFERLCCNYEIKNSNKGIYFYLNN